LVGAVCSCKMTWSGSKSGGSENGALFDGWIAVFGRVLCHA
jgi:hypothetical protein